MQRDHRKEPSQRVPVSRLLDWEALRRHAYRLLQSGPARGWLLADEKAMAQEGLLRVVKGPDEGAVTEHVVKARTAGAVDEDGFAVWFSTIDRHVATDDWRVQRSRDGARTVLEMTYWYGLTSAEVARVLGVSGCYCPRPAQYGAPQAVREHTGGITLMAHSQSSLPPASRPDITAFAEGVRARLPQRRTLPPEEVQGMERLGRWVQVLRTRHYWSLSTLATQTGLPWISLALLEQGMLLPAERTPEVLQQLGQAFPPQHAGPTPAELFRNLVPRLCALRLPPEEAQAIGAAHPAPALQDPATSPQSETRQVPARLPLYERLVLWLSPLWHPPMAGVPVTAAAPPTQTQTFYHDEGDIQVTCTWWGAEPGQPAALRLAWQADIAQAGTFWARFTRPEDATVVLAEVPLGSALAGEEVFAAQELGFDPSREPWALTFLLRQPDGKELSQHVPVRPDWDALWRKAYSLLQSRYAWSWQPADWEDMAQDVIVRVIEALDEGKVKEHVIRALEAGAVNEGPWVAWYSTIVMRVARDYWRMKVGRDGTRKYVGQEVYVDQEVEDVCQGMKAASVLAGIDIEDLLARTPLLPHEGIVLEMTYWQGLTSAEIAHVLGEGVSPATVRTWRSNALHKLRASAKEK